MQLQPDENLTPSRRVINWTTAGGVILLLFVVFGMGGCSLPATQQHAYSSCLEQFNAEHPMRESKPRGIEPTDYCWQIARAAQRDVDQRIGR